MSDPIGVSIVKLAVSPILFYQERVSGPPRWASPVAALVCCGVLTATAGVISTARALGEFRTEVMLLASVVSMFMFILLFWLQTGAVMVLARIFLFYDDDKETNGLRLVECSALAYWTQVPILAAGVGVWAMQPWGETALLSASAGIGEIMAAIENFTLSQEVTVWVTMFGDIAYYFSLWVVVLQAAALRAVTKFSVGGAWAGGILIGTVFVLLPWAFQRFS